MANVSDRELKNRTASSTSSSSSLTEYVNEAFEESELELSKVVSIHVSSGTTFAENPLASIPFDRDPETQEPQTLQDFSDLPRSAADPRGSAPRGFRKMYLAALAVLMFAVCMGVTGTYSATATADMVKPHSSIHPSKDEVTSIGSLMAVGALIGGTAGGYFANSLGRKGTLMFNTLPFVVGWLLIVYAKSTGVIYAGRILTGFSTGIVSVATPMYLVEISTPEVRGLLGASFQLFAVIGVLIVACLGSILTWRYLAVAGAIVSLLSAFLMLPMPESPRWLMIQKRRGEAKTAIIFLQGESYDAERGCQALEEEIRNQAVGSVQMKEFASPTLYKPFILSIALMFFQQFSGVNAVMFYTVDIFKSSKVALDPVLATIIVNFVQVVATVISSILMDRAGRKPLLLISGFLMAVSLYVFGGYDFSKSRDESIVANYGWLPVLCLTIFVTAFAFGFGPAPWLMVAEMTPSRFQSIVSGVATGLNWTFVFIITKTYATLQHDIQAYGVYWLYGTFCMISLIVTYFFLPETKGKTIQEIETFFNRKI